LFVAAAPVATARAATSAGILPRFERAVRTGRPAPGRQIRIGVTLTRPDPAGEDRLLAELYDPASPEYHRFGTPQAFARRFGVAERDVGATRRWLRAAGLEITSASRAGDYLVASGTVAQVERLTATSIASYRWHDTAFLANDRPPTAPRGLPIVSILGLDTLRHFRPARAGRAPAHPAQLPDTGTLTPQELWAIYQHPKDQTGAGVSVGIIGAGATDEVIDSLHSFDDNFGLPMLPVEVVRTPAKGDYTYQGVYGEWTLDVSAVHGMAPGLAKEVLYTSPTYADTDLIASLAAWASDPDGPAIFNESYGECEVTPLNPVTSNPALGMLDGNEHPSPTALVQYGIGNSSHPAEDQILKQAVMEGRSLFASAGDAGSGCGVVYFNSIGAGNGVLLQVAPIAEDPSNNPFAVGVGGTVLYKDPTDPPTRSVEYAWTHSGGNASLFVTAPDYQHGVGNLTRPCLLDPSGAPTNTGQLCRGVPDVAALSGDVLTNGYVSGGGTSLSAPLWAGMWARIQGSAGAGTGGFGFANEALYRIGKDAGRRARDFYDITIGTNGFNTALPGWDYVTGWGPPNLAPLLADVRATTPVRPGRAVGKVTCRDGKRPVSRIARRGAKASRSGFSVSGTAHDRGCGARGRGILARIEVAVARKTGKRCRFLSRGGGLGATRSCSRPRYLRAKGTGRWSLAIRRRLRAGSYVFIVRAVDLAGNRERPGKANRRTLRVS
jgi:subtilase family serine protease